MGQFINAIRISRSNMKMTIGNVRTLLIFLMLFFYIFEMLSDISLFSKSTNKNVTPYAFIFLINDYRVQFVIVACAVVLFCNAHCFTFESLLIFIVHRFYKIFYPRLTSCKF